MTIDENGFLDPDVAQWIEKHRKEHEKLFSLAESISRLAQAHLYKLNIHSDSTQEVLVALLFIRSLSTYQTTILLIERGLVTEARIILRNLLEILFKLRAISKDPEVGRTYVYEDEVQRKKFINKFKLLSDDVKKAQETRSLNDLLETIAKRIEDKDIKERQTQWYAQKAGLDDVYNSAYSIFSSSVHVNVRNLEELLLADDSGAIKDIIYGPEIATGIEKLLATAADSEAMILEDVSRIFALKLEGSLSELRSSLHQLFAG